MWKVYITLFRNRNQKNKWSQNLRRFTQAGQGAGLRKTK